MNPNGQATTWYFEYGASTSYGTRTGNVSAGSGTANTAASASVSGLTPGATYHYRVVATNSAGTVRGADGIFTTPAPPVAVTSPATSVAPTSATLNGSVDPNGRPTTWYFEYGTSTSYGSKTAEKSAGAGSSTAGVSGSVSALARGRVYHYRLVATSDAGTSRGADRTFTTLSVPSVGDRVGELDRADLGQAQRHRHPERPGHDVVLRVRDEHELRLEDRGAERRLRNEHGERLGVAHAPEDDDHVPLPPRRDERIGHDASAATGASARPSRPRCARARCRTAGSTTATLTGAVDPRGRATTWYFEYGTSTSYGSRTARRSAGSGSAVRSVSEPVSGLVAGATYHFRLVATSDAGTSRGTDGAFTTAGVTLATPARLVVYGRRITLTGSVPTRRGGEVVALLAQGYGAEGFTTIANVVTAADGSWRYLAKPTIRTSYVASWNRGSSPAATVGVRPAVSLRRLASGKVATRVRGGRLVRGPLRPAPAPLACGPVDHRQAGPPERPLGGDPAADGAGGDLGAPHRHEREPGRRGLSGRVQPAAGLPALTAGPVQ